MRNFMSPLDDTPSKGPRSYVLLQGFYDPRIIDELRKIGNGTWFINDGPDVNSYYTILLRFNFIEILLFSRCHCRWHSSHDRLQL